MDLVANKQIADSHARSRCELPHNLVNTPIGLHNAEQVAAGTKRKQSIQCAIGASSAPTVFMPETSYKLRSMLSCVIAYK